MKRTLCILCALTLCLTLLPQTAFAAGTDTGKAIQIGASGISGYDSTNGYDYIYYGEWDNSPIKWRVLDEQTNTQNEGLFLLSDVLLGTGTYGGVYFDNSGSDSNVWQKSTAQTWCKNFYSNNFSSKEQNAVLATTKSDSAYTSTSSGYAYGVSSLSGDKVFFLSAEEAENSAYGFTDNNARIANYGNSAGYWWLRSPYALDTFGAGLVRNIGRASFDLANHDWAARPAFNLDLNSVLFISAAEGGKISAAASGGNQGGEAAGSIFEIGDYTGNEWKLTLLDSSRNFSVTEETASGKPGDTITLNYTGATVYNADTAPNEYISVIIADDSGAQYYGRVAQPTEASGTVSIKIPDTLADGTYILNVFSEQYNGDYKTDYASAFAAVSLTIDTTAPTLSGGSATRDSETSATVKFTSSEAGTCYYIAQDTEITLTNAEIAAQGTKQACSAGENEIELDNLTASAWYAAVVVKDAVGNVSEILNLTIPAPTYTISASPAQLDFGSKTVGYAEAPAARTVTLTNTGNQNVTVNLPTSTNYIITAGDGFTNDTATLALNGTANFTIQPKTGLAVGDYSGMLTISGSNGAGAEISLAFTVEPISIENVQVNVAGEYTYDGDEIVPESDNVTVTLDGETLEADTDYTLAYSDNINAGTATVTVTGTGNYTGTATGNFTINKAEWTGVKTVEGTITPGTDGSVTLPAVPDGAALGTPAGDPEVENIAITGNVLSYTGGSGIENGKTYTVTVPVGETANYLAYDITVSLAGDTGSGLAQTAAGALRVFGTDGMLHITGTAAEAAVHDVRGVLVYRGTARTIHLPAGVYIVRAEEQVRKAVVK